MYMHMHTQIHTYMYKYRHTEIHTHKHACTHINMHAHRHINTHKNIYAHKTHINIHAHKDRQTHTPHTHSHTTFLVTQLTSRSAPSEPIMDQLQFLNRDTINLAANPFKRHR